MILLVHSILDVAGKNIAKHVLKRYQFKPTAQIFQQNLVYQSQLIGAQVAFITLETETFTAQELPKSFPDAELIVFISRHSSQSGTPTLTVHVPGNFGNAEVGGLSRTVSVCPANAMVVALKALNRQKHEKNLDFEVSYEVTHHGPSLSIPTMFVELGSSEKQWRNQIAAEAVAEAAMEAIATFGSSKQHAVLGIGGTHYNQKFTQMALAGDAVFSHMVPKYALSVLDVDMIRQCIACTLEKVDCAVLDWKGIPSEDKPRILVMLAELGLPFRRV
jgi:D-aminoacyl-tRNA deacylase